MVNKKTIINRNFTVLNLPQMRIPVQVKVSPVVREWMICYYGSHIIKPHFEDSYGGMIKLLLDLQPKEYVFKKLPEHECITFLMPHGSFEGNRNYNLYRNYLSPLKQRWLNRLFYYHFKEIFHFYMVGYLRGGSRTQRAAIEDFCKCYNIPLIHISYEMLKKSWDRSEHKIFFKKHLAHTSPRKYLKR